METREITVILITHRCLTVRSVDLSPHLDTVICKFALLIIPAEMLTDHHGIRVDSVYCIVISLEHINTELIVLRTLGIIITGICLCKTLGKVKTETVNLVLLKKILQALLYM